MAITTNKDGQLVVGQMGEMTQPGDSLLTIYDPKSGDLKASYETGLSDIAGLAYSPKTGKLYAADFSWHDTSQGGLFELTVSGDKCTAKKLYELDKPTALAFDDDGNLYITVFGTAEEGRQTEAGQSPAGHRTAAQPSRVERPPTRWSRQSRLLTLRAGGDRRRRLSHRPFAIRISHVRNVLRRLR